MRESDRARRAYGQMGSEVDLETVLMLRLREGDTEALAELYDRLASPVYALALHMLGSPEEAEEVLQDTFLKAYRTSDRYRPALGEPRTYLYTIARNACLSRLRKRSARPRKATHLDVHDAAAAFRGPAGGDGLTRMWIDAALEGIDEGDADLVRMAFFGGYSHSQLADRTGLPLGTVKSRLRRAMHRLRNRLEGQDAS